MLVLSRSKNETIVVGNNVRITVAEVKGNKVRLAIDVPPDVKVRRIEDERATQ